MEWSVRGKGKLKGEVERGRGEAVEGGVTTEG